MTTPEALERLIVDGRHVDVRRALAGLDEPARKSLLPVVKALGRRGVQETLSWQAGMALVVGQAATVSGAAAMADVLRVRFWRWSDAHQHVVGALLDRRPPWLPAVLERLVQRMDAPTGGDDVAYVVVEALRVGIGAPRPRAGAYLRGMADSFAGDDRPDLPELLRRDAEVVSLVPDLLAADGCGESLRGRDEEWWRDAAGRLERRPAPVEQTWAGALALLASEGVLDRATLLSTVLGTLLRGGSREHVSGLLAVHDALAATPADVARHRRTYTRLLSDGPGTVAKSALGLLRAATVAGQLEADGVLEAVEAAVRRREKGLATAGLTWAQQLAKAGTVPVDDVARVVASALGHERRDVQERALRVLGTVVARVRPETLAGLRADAEGLPAVLRPDAEAVLGPLDALDPGGTPPEQGRTPEQGRPPGRPTDARSEVPAAIPAPAPVWVAPPEPVVTDLAGLAAAVAAHLEDGDPRAAERVLDGVSRLAATDPAGFAAAMRPFVARLRPSEEDRRRAGGDGMPGSWDSAASRLLRAVLARPAMGWFGRSARSRELQRWTVPDGVAGCLDVRAREVAERVLAGRSGPLLAAPTGRTGAVDPEVLLDRLQTWAGLGAEPGVQDLEQAWLRVPREGPAAPDASWSARVRAVGSRAATWLARAVEHGPPDPRYRSTPVPPTTLRWGRPMPVEHSGIPVVDVLPPPGEPSSLVVRALTPAQPLPVVCTVESWEVPSGSPTVLSVLLATPQHREYAAAHLLPALLGTTRQCPPHVAEVLALLPEAGGPTGPATVLAIGWAATGSDLAARTAAADALRGFAAAGGLDGPAAGRVLGPLLLQPTVSVGRVSATLADAARGDGPTQRLVWELLAGALPSVIGSGRRGVPDLLGLAAELAAEVGARGTVEGLDAVTGPGGTRLASEARRLQEVLARV